MRLSDIYRAFKKSTLAINTFAAKEEVKLLIRLDP